MKRSEINAHIRAAAAFLKENNVALPPFAFWTPEDWAAKGPEADEIRRNRLGWDVTDFGGGDFARIGLVLFTLRNGNYNNPEDKKPYAEKIIVVREAQAVPMHFHRVKTEDIIVRAGGNLLIELHNSGPDAEKRGGEVAVSTDGVRRVVPAGTVLRLTPGESICLTPGMYHSFWGEPGAGTVILGEVSAVNDDYTDNLFHTPCGRFPAVENDAPPFRLLCTEYTAAAG